MSRDYSREFDEDMEIDLVDLPKPSEIKDILDQYVIGQEQAKKLWLSLFIIIIKELT